MVNNDNMDELKRQICLRDWHVTNADADIGSLKYHL